jgi:hypothetical protein
MLEGSVQCLRFTRLEELNGTLAAVGTEKNGKSRKLKLKLKLKHNETKQKKMQEIHDFINTPLSALLASEKQAHSYQTYMSPRMRNPHVHACSSSPS